MPRAHTPQAPLNVVFFGSTGCGKSSIVNMLLDCDRAKMSSSAIGCTFENSHYDVTIEKKNYRLHDTTGLDEGSVGTVVSEDAIVNLYHLLRDLQGGISLLVYCMRGPRIMESTERNYRVFYDGFCRQQAPIVIVVTGLEDQEPDMESWWTENAAAFENYGMKFDGHACITATRGKVKNGVFRNEAEYTESKVVLRDLIVEHGSTVKPFNLETKRWFLGVVKWIYRNLASWMPGITPRLVNLYEVLKSFLPETDARDIANRADLKRAVKA